MKSNFNKMRKVLVVFLILMVAFLFYLIGHHSNENPNLTNTKKKNKYISEIIFEKSDEKSNIDIFVFMQEGSRYFPLVKDLDEAISLSESLYGDEGDLLGALVYPLFRLEEGGYDWKFSDERLSKYNYDVLEYSNDVYTLRFYSATNQNGMFDFMKKQSEKFKSQHANISELDGISVFVKQDGLVFQAL